MSADEIISEVVRSEGESHVPDPARVAFYREVRARLESATALLFGA